MERLPANNRLRQFIAQESEALLTTLRLYLFRAGLTDEPLESAANDLLNDVVIEALEHEDRFRAGGQPRAWLLGVAANLVKRRQVERARRNRREPLARDLYAADDLSDEELFDRVAALAERQVVELEADDEAASWLALLSPPDQHVLRLAILSGLDGESLAAELDVTPGAARVRLHRALGRLREAMQKGESHAQTK